MPESSYDIIVFSELVTLGLLTYLGITKMVDKDADFLPFNDNFCLEFVHLISCAKLSKDLVLPTC
jgi:hypothetical protein